MNNALLVIVILLAFLILAFLIRFWLKLSDFGKPSEELLEYLKVTNTRLDEQNRLFTKALHDSTKVIDQRLDSAYRVVSSVQKSLGEVTEIGRSMKEFQEFLQSPKLRGNIGEQVLKEILIQFLPKQIYSFQYTFRSGEKVDAVIKTSAGLVAIDAKFPMENFRKMYEARDSKEREKYKALFLKDVKKHITDISRKYIMTQEGTVDFALMYLPSEAVYYEVANNAELFEFATEKRVLPVSATTFFAYVKAILMSFEGQKIESQAKEILMLFRAIQSDYKKLGSYLSLLQRHLNNAYNSMNSVLGGFAQLGQRIVSVKKLGSGKDEVKREIPEGLKKA